jgi:hypothetical protein
MAATTSSGTNHMKRYLITIAVALLTGSCAGQGHTPSAPKLESHSTTASVIAETDWIGVYASTREIDGFAGTVLALEEETHDEINYRMRSYSDVSSANDIEQDEQRGSVLVDGRTLYLPGSDWVHERGQTEVPRVDHPLHAGGN